MPRLSSIGTALPEYRYTSDEILKVDWLREPRSQELFRRFISSGITETRHFVQSVDGILSLNGLQGRSALFEEHAPPLGISALNSALRRAGMSPEQIDSVVFTSCSCPSIPSVDALIVEGAGLARTTQRLPMYQQGCAGGVVGLGLATDLAAAGKRVALCSVELCSLVFNAHSPNSAELVGSALFADGAACAIITPENSGFRIRAKQSFLLEDTRHLMGYEIQDDGFHLRLDKELPTALNDSAPKLIDTFLEAAGLSRQDIGSWLFHPGGVKILDFLERTLGLERARCRWAREVLRDVGNLSSATVLFVLNRFLETEKLHDGAHALLVGVGPGLTVELVLFEYQE